MLDEPKSGRSDTRREKQAGSRRVVANREVTLSLLYLVAMCLVLVQAPEQLETGTVTVLQWTQQANDKRCESWLWSDLVGVLFHPRRAEWSSDPHNNMPPADLACHVVLTRPWNAPGALPSKAMSSILCNWNHPMPVAHKHKEPQSFVLLAS